MTTREQLLTGRFQTLSKAGDTAKRKKGNRKKRKSFKAETIKRL